MLNSLRTRQLGISLVELMVGMAVSLVVLWGISVVYINTSASSRTSSAVTQVNQDLRAMMDIMVADIRRAGSWGKASSGTNPFSAAATDLAISSDGQCILYSYDATYAGGTSGVVDAVDVFGFRVSSGVLQTLIPGSLTTTATTACTNDAVWDNLSDGRAVTLAMSLSTRGSQCVAFNPETYNAGDTATYTSWATTGGVGAACLSTAPGAPTTYPAATNTFMETRQVTITLTVTSKTDATLTRAMSDTALVRNNRVISP